MSTNFPVLFRTALKSRAIRTAAKQAAARVEQKFTQKLQEVQTNVLSKDVYTAEVKDVIKDAVNPANRNNRPLQRQFHALKVQDPELAALTETVFKKDTATFHSTSVVGVPDVKYPSLTHRVTRQQGERTRAFIDRAMTENRQFDQILSPANRTHRVSARMATRGKDGTANYSAHVAQYKDNELLDTLEDDAATEIKILEKGKGRILAPGLYHKMSPKPGETVDAFRQRLTETANPMLQTTEIISSDAYDPNHLSSRMLYRSPLRRPLYLDGHGQFHRQLNLNGQKQFNQMGERLGIGEFMTPGEDTKLLIDELKELYADYGIKVKVMSGAVRITRHDINGNVLPGTIKNKLKQGETMDQLFERTYQQVHNMLNKPLPAQTKRQQIRNFFRPLKKGITNLTN